MSKLLEPLRKVIAPSASLKFTTQDLRALRKHGVLPAMAGGSGFAGFVDNDGVSVDDAYLTVADYVNPPSRIPALVRDLVAENEGYWIEEVFATPGFTVEGGAIIYSETFPQDHFLADEGRPAPRAPGAEAPLLLTGRVGKLISRVESWSGAIEVHDETRRRNRVDEVQRQFRATANTFADILQARGEEVLASFVAGSGRNVESGAGTFADWAAADSIYLTTSTDPRPSQEFARVQRLFIEDKAGVRPDTLIVSTIDAEHLDRVYEGTLTQVLQRYGLRLRVSARLDAGKRLYVKSGQVGVLAFEKPLDQEYERISSRWTDRFNMETTPVFVANGAEALLQVEKT